jgi:hypothetical protein
MALETVRIHTAAIRCRDMPEIWGTLSMAPFYFQVAGESGVRLPEEEAAFSRLPNGQVSLLYKDALAGKANVAQSLQLHLVSRLNELEIYTKFPISFHGLYSENFTFTR